MTRVCIVGGSVAGCLSALVFRDLGFEITVIERSAAALTDRGAAVVIPRELFATLKSSGFVDRDMSHLVHQSISFRAHRYGIDADPLWSMPADVVALRWGHLYEQLRKRVDDGCYHSGVGVTGIHQRQGGAVVSLDDGGTLEADLLVAADGIHSIGRNHVWCDQLPSYSGYVLWRGLLDEAAIASPGAFEGIYWAPYNGGLAGAYFVAGSRGDVGQGCRTLNWGIYDKMSPATATRLVPGFSQTNPTANRIGDAARRRLKELAVNVLPEALRQVALDTENLFVQPIVDILPERLARGRSVLVGDASAVLRPHSASGISKAVQNVLALSASIAASDDLDRAIRQWEREQLQSLAQLGRLSRSLGAGMVTDAPDWDLMTPQDMPAWWQSMTAGRQWFMDRERARGDH